MTRLIAPLLTLAVLALAGCAAKPDVTQSDVDALAREIAALGPEVDAEEARRAARIAYDHPRQLAEDWRVTGSPLVHNGKVLHGFREKGLCNDWTDAMLTRLRAENFETLSLHWATSPPENFRVIHHSAMISARGDGRDEGIVLDPWRWGGTLFWAHPEDDARYDWGPPILAKRAATPEGGKAAARTDGP